MLKFGKLYLNVKCVIQLCNIKSQRIYVVNFFLQVYLGKDIHTGREHASEYRF